ncbi:MAG: sporulation integral membrane protein YtvI [Limnochordales bacterium]|nr:sporulation integral membrane protein YtvI [Limnochordales bacterium]
MRPRAEFPGGLVGVLLLALLLYFYRELAAVARAAIAVSLPFLVGLLVAAMIEPTVSLLTTRGVPRGLATFFTMLLGVTLVAYLLTAITLQVNRELADLAARLGDPQYQRQVVERFTALAARIGQLYRGLPTSVLDAIDEIVRHAYGSLQEIVSRVAASLVAFAGQIPIILIMVIVIFVSTFFFARDWEVFSAGIFQLLPPQLRRTARRVAGQIRQDVVGYVRGQLLLLLITTFLAAVGFALLHVRYWMLLALLCGVLDLVPILGPPLLIFPWAAVALLTGELRLGVGLLIIYGVIFTVRQFSESSILGRAVGIHPLLMLGGVYGGLLLMGGWGVFIGPLLVIVGRALYHAWQASRS